MTDEQQQQRLSALLRLKRYEQPPPGYYQKLLSDVHRRQRVELLRRPLWKIALERMHTFMGEHSLANLSYAGATAAAVVAGLAVVGLSLPGDRDSKSQSPASIASASTSPAASSPTATTTALASVSAPAPKPVDLRAEGFGRGIAPRLLSLQGNAVSVALPVEGNEPVVNARLFPVRASQDPVVLKQPRYIIDSRPASYEAATVSYQF